MLRVICVILAGATAIAAASPNGRVVRVERKREIAIPWLCGLTSPTQALCLGKPVPDERILVIDQRRGAVIGELRVDVVSEANDVGLCTRDAPPLYKVHGTLITGDAAAIDDGNPMGVHGAALRGPPRVVQRQRSPRGVDTEKVEVALDTTDDGQSDLVITQYTCDQSSGSPPAADVCIDTYVRRADRLTRVRQHVLHRCM